MYLGTIQENKNGNGKLTLTADNLKFACAELGISDDKHTLRRAARGFDLYYRGCVEHVNNHTFRVESQYNRQSYQVTLHYGATKPYGYCTCQDWMNYSGDMDVPNVDHWCKHMISAALWLHTNGGGNGSKPTSECGTSRAKAIQAKLNSQLNKSGTNGTGATGGFVREGVVSTHRTLADNHHKAPSQPTQLDISAGVAVSNFPSNPFQQSEQLDIDQIESAEGAPPVEGRSNGELVHRLSNGEYVISYKGIMKLSEKHDIEFELATHDDTNTIIAKGRRNGSERVSGKPINGSVKTSGELAKRNCARQLLPFAEIKALELKAKLEADFDWQKAKSKCVELALTLANVDIIIHELVQAGDLRQDNPSHYNRIEWLIIHNACKKDREVRVREVADTSPTTGREDARLREQSDDNDGGGNSPPSPILDPRKASFTHRTLKSVNNWSYNSPEFISKCRDAIGKFDTATPAEQKVRDDKVEAKQEGLSPQITIEMPLQKPEGKRKLQMDSKLRTFLIETDLTSKAISCREICEKFESNIVTRLRAGIDSGADLSTVELDD